MLADGGHILTHHCNTSDAIAYTSVKISACIYIMVNFIWGRHRGDF